MAIKVNGNTVVTDEEKGQFKSANPGAYTTEERNTTLSPAAGDMIFNTTEGKLQVWNGQTWLDAGGAPIDESVPQIREVTLSETPGTNRFTNKDFDIDIDMVTNGVPASTKAVKAKVTATFPNYQSTDPITGNTGSDGRTTVATFSGGVELPSSISQSSHNAIRYCNVTLPGVGTQIYGYYNYSSYFYEFIVNTNDSSISYNNLQYTRSCYKNSLSDYSYVSPVNNLEGYTEYLVWNQSGYNYYGGICKAVGAGSNENYVTMGVGWAAYDKNGRMWVKNNQYDYNGSGAMYNGSVSSSYSNSIIRNNNIGPYNDSNYSYCYELSYGTIQRGYDYNACCMSEDKGTVYEAVIYNNQLLLREFDVDDELGTYDGNYGTYPWSMSLPSWGQSYYVNNMIHVANQNRIFLQISNSSSDDRCGVGYIDLSTKTFVPNNQYADNFIPTMPKRFNDETPDRIYMCLNRNGWSSSSSWDNWYTVYSDDCGETWVNYIYQYTSYYQSTSNGYYYMDFTKLDGYRVGSVGNDSWGSAPNGSTSYYARLSYERCVYSYLTFETQKNLGAFTPGKLVYLLGSGDKEGYQGRVNYSDSSNVYVNSDYFFKENDILRVGNPISQEEKAKWLQIDENGNVQNYGDIEYDYQDIGPGLKNDLTFPDKFENNAIPDEAFPSGSKLQVMIKAYNDTAESTQSSNIVTPVGLNPVSLKLKSRALGADTTWLSDGGGDLAGISDANADVTWRDQDYWINKSIGNGQVAFYGDAKVGTTQNFSLTFSAAELNGKVVVIGSNVYKTNYASSLIKLTASSSTANVTDYDNEVNQNGTLGQNSTDTHKFLIADDISEFTIDFEIVSTADEGSQTKCGQYQIYYYRLEDTAGNAIAFE